MSIKGQTISHEAVIPTIDSHLFDESDAQFAVGVLAVNDQVLPDLEREYSGYYDLRRNVYVYQTGQLDERDLQPDGTDRDLDDSRSIALGVVENRGFDQRLIATMRLIVKSGEGVTLPIEKFCPEVFIDQSAPLGSLEVSRLISRHEKPSTQDFAKWLIYGAGLAQSFNKNLRPAYAIVEPEFEKLLNSTVPVKRLGEPRYVDHYLGDNLPIEIDTINFIDTVRSIFPDILDTLIEANGAMSYFGQLATLASPSNHSKKT